MNIALPDAGAAKDEIARLCQETWLESATKAGIDLSGFNPDLPLAQRIAWALEQGLDIGGILTRFSNKMQHSTASQVHDCTEFGAWHKIYVTPEFVCVDEAVTGRKSRRDGLERMKFILRHKLAGVLVVFKLSRLFRAAYKGYQFFQEEVVDAGLRGISITQGVDTKDVKIWKALTVVHGLADDFLLEAISDHVSSGLRSIFKAGYSIGVTTVGYRPVAVEGAPLTNRGTPRTMPQIVPETAQLMRQHYEWIRDGMPIREGWRRWIAAGGPCDRRSKSSQISYGAYRRMLSNPRYTGRWAFGRLKNVWSGKRDYVQQVLRPDKEVTFKSVEGLRIIDDELFFAVQKRLEELKRGPQGPKKQHDLQLWDLVTEFFFCAVCNVRFHQSGANGVGMTCKRGDLCPCKSIVKRKPAVQAVCQKLSELIQRDSALIEEVITRAQEVDATGDDAAPAELADIEKQIVGRTNKIDDLTELAGQGTDEDRVNVKAKIQAAQMVRADLRHRQAEICRQLEHRAATISAESVRQILVDLQGLLENAASGKLGSDVMFRAAGIFRQLTGGRVLVHVEKRACRKHSNVRGVFRAGLLQTVGREAGDSRSDEAIEAEPVEVWLRKPPRQDLLADRVFELVDRQGLSLEAAASVLRSEGHAKVNCGVVWNTRHRYYEMHGLTMPRRYKQGRPDHSDDGQESA